MKSIEKAINSLVVEDSVSKIFLIDNGEFCNWIKKLNNPKVETIAFAKNVGFGAGHNAVLNKYKNQTEFFLLCNPDSYFEAGELDKLYLYAKKHQLDLAVPKIVYPDGQIQYNCKLLPNPTHLFLRRFLSKKSEKHNKIYELREADFDQPFFAPFYSGCFMLLSNLAINKIGCFDTRFFLYMEDVDLSRRISSKLNTSFCPVATITHEFEKGSYKKWALLRRHIFSAVCYFNKWGWLFDEDRVQMNKLCLNKLPKRNR